LRNVKNSDIKREPYLLWNEYVDILAMEEFEPGELKLRDASLVFWYDSELQNGGHLQYFENRGTDDAQDTISALVNIGAVHQKDIFEKALKLWSSKERMPIEEVDEYVSQALDGEFDDLDSEYYECLPDMNSYLEKYLERYKDEFFRFE
jgi:hypothetical protein